MNATHHITVTLTPPRPCPTCGKCPTCGQGATPPQLVPYYPGIPVGVPVYPAVEPWTPWYNPTVTW